MFGLFGKPSKKTFATRVLREIVKAGGPSFDLNMDEFEIRSGSTKGYLENTYLAYCDAKGARRDAILANFVSAMTAKSAGTFDDVRSELVSVVRERALISFTTLLWQLDSVEHGPRLLSDPISDWFTRAAVIDAPGHMTLVTEEQVRSWAQSSDEIFNLGLGNLRNAKRAKFAEENGVFRGTWDDDYDSSRILIPGIFDDLPLKGDPVVTIPNRLTLLVAGSDDIDALRRMLTLAEEITRTKPRPQNPAPLLVQNGEISDYTVPPSSPIFNEVQRAKRVAAAGYYQEQKNYLEKMYSKHGKEYFVATLTLFQLPSGTYVSRAVWTKGVPTLLPVADEITFVDLDKPEGYSTLGSYRWEAVKSSCGDLLLDTGMFPNRYFVSQFPSPSQLEIMRQP